MTTVVDGHSLVFTALDGGAMPVRILSSVALHLPEPGHRCGSTTLVLYAGAPRAFDDFAVDLTTTLGVTPGAVVLDQHLTAPAVGEGIRGLAELSQVNQAIGILLVRGHTPDSARSELHRLARAEEIPVATAAQQVLSSNSHRPSTDPS